MRGRSGGDGKQRPGGAGSVVHGTALVVVLADQTLDMTAHGDIELPGIETASLKVGANETTGFLVRRLETASLKVGANETTGFLVRRLETASLKLGANETTGFLVRRLETASLKLGANETTGFLVRRLETASLKLGANETTGFLVRRLETASLKLGANETTSFLVRRLETASLKLGANETTGFVAGHRATGLVAGHWTARLAAGHRTARLVEDQRRHAAGKIGTEQGIDALVSRRHRRAGGNRNEASDGQCQQGGNDHGRRGRSAKHDQISFAVNGRPRRGPVDREPADATGKREIKPAQLDGTGP